jgi:6-phosphogluconate dehydrogenase
VTPSRQTVGWNPIPVDGKELGVSSNENPAQTNISTDRDQDPGSTEVHEGAPSPQDVPRAAPTPTGPSISTEPTANIGVVGLAVMGSNLARNLASREGNTVAVYIRTASRTDELLS